MNRTRGIVLFGVVCLFAVAWADNLPTTCAPGSPDQDGDGTADLCDNCPDIFNDFQTDTDSDGFGDACDNCPGEWNLAQADCDDNGIGDTCDIPCPPTPTPCDQSSYLGSLDIAFCLFRYEVDENTPCGSVSAPECLGACDPGFVCTRTGNVIGNQTCACEAEPSYDDLVKLIDSAREFNEENSEFTKGNPGYSWNTSIWGTDPNTGEPGYYEIPFTSAATATSDDLQACLDQAYAEHENSALTNNHFVVSLSPNPTFQDVNYPNGVLQQAVKSCSSHTVASGVTINYYPAWLYKLRTGSNHTHGGAVAHEVAHNYGAHHARWISSISGEYREYGNRNDTMGGENITMGHFQAAIKERLAWMNPVPTVAVSGEYQIAPLETAMNILPSGVEHALRIDLEKLNLDSSIPEGLNSFVTLPSPGDLYYYLEYRQQSDPALTFNATDGLLVNRVIVPRSSTDFPTGFGVDMTPDTPFHQSFDAALPPGRSYVDLNEGLVLTNLGNDASELRVYVHFIDDNESNFPPTLETDPIVTSTQSSGGYDVTFDASNSIEDLDTDAADLVYFWNFDVDWYKHSAGLPGEGDDRYDPLLGNYGSGPVVTQTFPDSTPRTVYLKVSDRRGGETDWIPVAWGTLAPKPVYDVPSALYPDIQDAIDAANDGATVRVAPNHLASDPRDLNLDLKNKRITVDGTGSTIDCGSPGNSNRAFVFSGVETQYSVVQGFVIRDCDPGADGGAILVSGHSNPLIRNNSFISNSGVNGGAVAVTGRGHPRLEGNTFVMNSASQNGGAVHVTETALGLGGATLIGNQFVLNQAVDGGALYLTEDSTQRYRHTELYVVNNEFVSNTASGRGGAIFLDAKRDGFEPAFNTFAGNMPDGISVNTVQAGTRFRNNILWDTTPLANAGTTDDIAAARSDGRMVLRHNIIRGGWAEPSQPGNVANVDLDPRFVNESALNLKLKWNSPAIDAAETLTGDLQVDRLGHARFDDPNVSNGGAGAPVFADIGANERLSTGGGCFAPGTPISVADGSTLPIESIQAGDLVLAYDETSGTLVPARVRRTYIHRYDGLLVSVGGVLATPNHPFRVNGQWTQAAEIREGDALLERRTIGTRGFELIPGLASIGAKVPFTGLVYNLEVERFATYFADGMLVHNKNPPGNQQGQVP